MSVSSYTFLYKSTEVLDDVLGEIMEHPERKDDTMIYEEADTEELHPDHIREGTEADNVKVFDAEHVEKRDVQRRCPPPC